MTMTIDCACPHCRAAVRLAPSPTDAALHCPVCSTAWGAPAAVGDRLRQCLVCGSPDLFVRKDFPQRLGVAIVAAGIVGSSVAWYYGNLWWTFGVLFASALADLALFASVGDALMCYRCSALYRGVVGMEEFGPFHLETHEKHRQAAARKVGPPLSRID